MMGRLRSGKHQGPRRGGGKGAAGIVKAMAPYHMSMELVEGEAGAATSIKFIRSITAKGISALLIESLQAAQRFGVEQTIVDSFLDSYGDSFLKIVNGYVSGAIIHANRREHEMQNVVDFLKQENLPYLMAEATRQKLEWIEHTEIKENFHGEVPRNWQGVLAGWNL